MLVKVDAAQLEWRTVLELSRDPVGIEEVLNKVDAHANNQQVFGLPSRLIAKIYLFRQIFLGSSYSYANDPDFMHVSTDTKFWDGVAEKFFTKYNQIPVIHNKWMEQVVAGKPIEGPFGRDWFIEMKRDWRGELKIPWTQLANYPVQGTGADVMMLARLSLARRLKASLGDEVKFISTVHDDIKMDAPEKHVQFIVDTCHQVFADLIPNIRKCFDYEWVVPMECECYAGMNMKEAYEKDKDGNKVLVNPGGLEIVHPT